MYIKQFKSNINKILYFIFIIFHFIKKIIKIHKLEQLQGKIANLEKEVATLIRKKEYFYNNSDDSIEELEHSLEMMDTHT